MSTDRHLFLLDSIGDHLALGRSLSDISRRLRAIASDEEIEAALFEFKSKNEKIRAPKSVSLLRGEHAVESWYVGPSDDPTSHWQLLTDVLRNKKSRPWSDEMINSLDHSSSMVVANLSPPKSVEPRSVKGLVLGYVQSGKTANFSAVISKAVDAGYRFVVVLAGMHNILRLQTQARLNEELVEPKKSACTTLTRVDEFGDFQRKQAVAGDRALGSSDGFCLVVLKKNSAVLRSFNSWLDATSKEVLASCPTLIIDDESDQASVNTAKPENDPTAINDHIRNIIKKFRVSSYVGYTATPFANVLIDASLDDDLYPKDFVVSLDKPVGYVGAEELFGRDAIEPKGALNGIPVIRTIPDNDADRHSPARSTKSPVNNVITGSLAEAIDAFIVGCSARLSRNQWGQHMTMLIHTSQLVLQHTELKSAIDQLVLDMKLDRRDNMESFKERLKLHWERDFVRVSKLFKAAEIPAFDIVWRNSEKLIERLEVIMENHESEERLTYDRPDPFWGIVVGGNTLSRGLTLEGLTTSYFVRNSKGYDTLLQMGRWFGYRPNYVDLTRIYVTEELQSKFYHLATVEEEVRDEIKTMAANCERPIDVGLKIRTHPAMTVTSNLKMRQAKQCSLTYSGAKIQALYMNLNDKGLISKNLNAVARLLDDAEKFSGKPTKPSFEELNAALVYRNVDSELILQFLERYEFSPANIRFSSKMISDYITDLAKVHELTKWSVALMSTKTGEQVEIGKGRLVRMVDRSIVKMARSDRDPTASHVKVVTAPRDEIVDLEDVLATKNMRVLSKDDPFENSGLTETSIRQNIRPVERGLLLLYPISPNLHMPAEDVEQYKHSLSQTMPLRAIAPVIGVAFVFPKSLGSKSTYRYVVNGSV